jgi:molecular chaperone DnaJ
MKRLKNHYQVLGVEPQVSTAQIKRAYRNLVKELHPDLQESNGNQTSKESATEDMMELNAAYETLMDARRRSEYDIQIGIRKGRTAGKPTFAAGSEDEARERFLGRVFHPARTSMVRILNQYKKNLRDLSQDPFDDELLEGFQNYADEVESALRKASDDFSRNPAPHSLKASVLMMRNSIAQAADGLEEMRTFCLNFDYGHLNMAGNLFKIALDLSKQALELTKAGQF